MLLAIVTGLSCRGNKFTHSEGKVAGTTEQYAGAPPVTTSARAPNVQSTNRADIVQVEELTTLVRDLQKAVARADRERFARILTYPLLIKTASYCNVRISGPEELVRYFDFIVSDATRQAILDFQPPTEIDYRGYPLGNIVFNWDGNTFKVSWFRTNIWRLPMSSCFGEPDRPPPPWLDGKWRIASVVRLGFLPKVDAAIEINLVDRRAHITIEGKADECRVERFAARTASSDDAFTASHWGLTAGAKEDEILDLDCGSSRQLYRIEVLKPGVLGLFRGEYTIVFRRERPVVAIVHSRGRGQTCGTPFWACDAGLTCEATLETLDTPTCNLIAPEP